MTSQTLPATSPSNRDPVHFAEQVFGVTLWRLQKQILRAIERDRRVAVRACHASSKSHTSALAALWFACRYHPARVLILAPGWLTTRLVIWSEIHSLLAHANYRLPLTLENQTQIQMGPDNMIVGLSTNDSARLQGHHSENVLLIADESPGIDETFWPAIEGILASGNSHLLLLGNPVTNTGYFREAFSRNKSAFTTFSISAFQTPNLQGLTLEQLLALPDADLDKNPMPFLATRRWVKERYAEWWNGSLDNSPLWQSRVLGEFPSASSNALIALNWLEAAQGAPVDSGKDVIAGIDPAGPGKDRTAAVICCEGAILAVGVWTDSDARGPVIDFLRQWDRRLQLVRVDSAGLGFYFAESIRDKGFRTEGINVAGRPEDPERFANLKAERYWHLRERFQRNEVSGLTDEMLAELAAITWLIDPQGRTAIEGKVEVRAVLGRSPDLAEALMIAIGDTGPARIEWHPAPKPLSDFDGYWSGDNFSQSPRERHEREDRARLRQLARWGRRWQNSGY